MSSPILVYRGLSVKATMAHILELMEPGVRISPTAHPWWARSKEAAVIYATTGSEPKAVILTAELYTSFELPNTPLLPNLGILAKRPAHQVLIRLLEVKRL